MPLKDKTERLEYQKLWLRKRRKKFPSRDREYRKKYLKKERVAHLQRKFGLSLEQYETMLRQQSGRCKICHRPEIKKRNGVLVNLSVDHDHATNRIRGLLCVACNAAIGLMGDIPERLRLAADYLEQQ